jgi:hypothetical protein
LRGERSVEQRERLAHGSGVVGRVVGLVDLEQERVLANELHALLLEALHAGHADERVEELLGMDRAAARAHGRFRLNPDRRADLVLRPNDSNRCDSAGDRKEKDAEHQPAIPAQRSDNSLERRLGHHRHRRRSLVPRLNSRRRGRVDDLERGAAVFRHWDREWWGNETKSESLTEQGKKKREYRCTGGGQR